MTKCHIEKRKLLNLIQITLESPRICSELWDRRRRISQITLNYQSALERMEKVRRASTMAIFSTSLESLIPTFLENSCKTSPRYVIISIGEMHKEAKSYLSSCIFKKKKKNSSCIQKAILAPSFLLIWGIKKNLLLDLGLFLPEIFL